MEILMLVLFYYLSQNPDFAKSVQPLMSQIKDSQQMLSFLSDLSKFSETFSTFKEEKKEGSAPSPQQDEKKKSEPKTDEKTPQSPTSGIADEFIQNILDGYLKKR